MPVTLCLLRHIRQEMIAWCQYKIKAVLSNQCVHLDVQVLDRWYWNLQKFCTDFVWNEVHLVERRYHMEEISIIFLLYFNNSYEKTDWRLNYNLWSLIPLHQVVYSASECILIERNYIKGHGLGCYAVLGKTSFCAASHNNFTGAHPVFDYVRFLLHLFPKCSSFQGCMIFIFTLH